MSNEQTIELQVVGVTLQLSKSQILELARKGVRAHVILRHGFKALCSRETFASSISDLKSELEHLEPGSDDEGTEPDCYRVLEL